MRSGYMRSSSRSRLRQHRRARLVALARCSGRGRARPPSRRDAAAPPLRPPDVADRRRPAPELGPPHRPDPRRLPVARHAGRARPLRRRPLHRLRPQDDRRRSRTTSSSALLEARDGALWVGLNGGGVVRMRDGQPTRWSTAEGLSSNAVVSLVETPDGDDLGRHLRRRAEPHRDGRRASRLSAAATACRPMFCYAPRRRARRLVLDCAPATASCTRRDGRFRTYTARGGLADDMVHAVAVDAQGVVWFGTASGLSRFDRGRWRTYTRADGLTADDVVALGARPRRHDLDWHAHGRAQSPARRPLRQLHLGRGAARTTSSTASSRTAKATSGSASTPAASRACAPRRSRRCRCATACRPTASAACSRRATAASGSAPTATASRTSQTAASPPTATREGLPNGAITALAEARDGTIWIGTRVGVSRLKNGHITTFTTADGLPQSDVRALLQDRHGVIWVGTVGGVCRMNADGCVPVPGLDRRRPRAARARRRLDLGGRLRRPHPLHRTARSPRSRRSDAHSKDMLFVDRRGCARRAVARDVGRRAAALRGRPLHALSRRRTACSTTPSFRVLPDSRGWLWLTCNRGLSRVLVAELDALARGHAPHACTPTVYAEADGLPTSEFNGGSSPAGMVARDGRLWLPSIKGVVVVDPARLTRNAVPPPVVIEQVLVDRRRAGSAASRPTCRRVAARSRSSTPRSASPRRRACASAISSIGFDPDWVDAGESPHGVLHEHSARPLHLPGQGRQQRRRVERSRARATRCSCGRTSIRRRGSSPLGALGVLVVGYGGVRLRVRQLRATRAAAGAARRRADARARGSARSGGRSLAAQVGVPRQRQPRDPHADERRHRHDRSRARRAAHAARCAAISRRCARRPMRCSTSSTTSSTSRRSKRASSSSTPTRFDLRALVDDVLGLLAPRAADKGLRLTQPRRARRARRTWSATRCACARC